MKEKDYTLFMILSEVAGTLYRLGEKEKSDRIFELIDEYVDISNKEVKK